MSFPHMFHLKRKAHADPRSASTKRGYLDVYALYVYVAR
jgi:hypothetical protein